MRLSKHRLNTRESSQPRGLYISTMAYMQSQLPHLAPLLPSAFTLAFCLVALYLARAWALPRPIPGIPFNKPATQSILGDVPAWLDHVKKTGEVWSWMTSQIIRHDHPLIQVFVKPFSKPTVVISDFRESQDILLRRTKEFDRSSAFADALSGIAPDHHIIMRSTEPEFKVHRRLIQDLMTPAFLSQVGQYLQATRPSLACIPC